jgi:hypothetical protein
MLKELWMNKGGFLILALVAGYILGICPVTAFVLGYNYEKAKQGIADMNLAFTYIGIGLVGQILSMIV